MNIFIIYSGNYRETAKETREAILKAKKKKFEDKKEKLTVSYLVYEQGEWKPGWKRKATELIKEANIVLYLLGPDGHKSRYIDWELKTALKFGKKIKYIEVDKVTEGNTSSEKEYEINKVLIEKDTYTNEKIIRAEKLSNLNDLYQIIQKDCEKGYINLLNDAKEKKTNLDVNVILEQYKFFAETSEALVNRRQNVNSFYIKANTALIAVIATAFSSSNSNWIVKLIVLIILSTPGILLNVSWKKILEAYGITNSSKLKILNMLEKQLEVSLYAAEWDDMSYPYNKKQYVCFTESEMRLPRVFNILYVCIIIISLVALSVLIGTLIMMP